MILDELATYLSLNGVGTVGTDLFVATLPPTPDTCVTLLEYGGGPIERTQGDDFIEVPRIQVVSRGTDYAAIRAKAKVAWDALAKVHNRYLSGVFYMDIMPLQSPFLNRRDENQRFEVVFNVEVTKNP